MRDLAHGFFTQSPAMAGPLLALVLFFVVFVAALLRVLRTRPADWASQAALPLDDAPPTSPSNAQGEKS